MLGLFHSCVLLQLEELIEVVGGSPLIQLCCRGRGGGAGGGVVVDSSKGNVVLSLLPMTRLPPFLTLFHHKNAKKFITLRHKYGSKDIPSQVWSSRKTC